MLRKEQDTYPSRKVLQTIKNWLDSLGGLLCFVIDEWNTDFGKATISLLPHNHFQYDFFTGGWSGNEDLIAALSKNFYAWSQLWESSHRGGRFVFVLKNNESEKVIK